MLRVRAVLNGWEGGPGLMTFYFLTPLQNAAAAARVVGNVHDFLFSPVSSFLPSSVTAQVLGEVDVLDASNGHITDTLSAPIPPPVVGAGSASKAPPSVAALLRLQTATFIAGRRVRGRIFISPLAGTVVTSDGVLSNTQQAFGDAARASMVAVLDPGDTWVVWHRPKLGVGGSAAAITATSMPFKLAVLTSRRD